MKTILKLALAAILAVSASFTVSAQTEITQQKMKEINKTAKQLAKKNTREGWNLVESTTMEGAVKDLLMRKAAGGQEIVGTAYGKRDMVVARTSARNAAINEYAEYSKSIVRARLNTDIQDLGENEVNNLVAGYERLVLKEIDGELVPVYSVYREKGGRIDVKSYFIVDVEAASAARKRALKIAAEEAELAHRYGDEISEFVNSGFDNLKTIGEE